MFLVNWDFCYKKQSLPPAELFKFITDFSFHSLGILKGQVDKNEKLLSEELLQVGLKGKMSIPGHYLVFIVWLSVQERLQKSFYSLRTTQDKQKIPAAQVGRHL